jgi:GH15 family glucan-1,4-alpha-glucosidase
MTKRIEDYALIGDCENAALVARDGSIDWLCRPRFDSGALFAALLGAPENGHWSMSGGVGAATRRRYRDGALILETDFETGSGAVTLIDFMPFHRVGPSRLIHLVQGRSGEVDMVTEFMLRFDYGLIASPLPFSRSPRAASASSSQRALCLPACPLRRRQGLCLSPPAYHTLLPLRRSRSS